MGRGRRSSVRRRVGRPRRRGARRDQTRRVRAAGRVGPPADPRGPRSGGPVVTGRGSGAKVAEANRRAAPAAPRRARPAARVVRLADEQGGRGRARRVGQDDQDPPRRVRAGAAGRGRAAPCRRGEPAPGRARHAELAGQLERLGRSPPERPHGCSGERAHGEAGPRRASVLAVAAAAADGPGAGLMAHSHGGVAGDRLARPLMAHRQAPGRAAEEPPGDSGGQSAPGAATRPGGWTPRWTCTGCGRQERHPTAPPPGWHPRSPAALRMGQLGCDRCQSPQSEPEPPVGARVGAGR